MHGSGIGGRAPASIRRSADSARIDRGAPKRLADPVPKAPSLARAAAELGHTRKVLDELVRWLSAEVPGVRFFACVYRSHPALEMAVSSHARDGRLELLDGVPEAFASSPTAFDRWAVEAPQQNRFLPVFPAVVASPKLRGAWGAIGPQDRIVLCQGTRPLGYVSASLAPGASWPPGLRRAVRLKYRKISRILWLAALDWRGRHDPVDLSSGLEGPEHGAFFLSPEGLVLASSASARRWRRHSEELDAFLLDVEARGWPGAERQRLSGYQLERGHIDTSSGRGYQVLRCARTTREPPPLLTELPLELTPRERELCQWLVSGETNAALAERLGVRPSTVKTMLERLYDKLGAPGRVALTRRLLAPEVSGAAERRP